MSIGSTVKAVVRSALVWAVGWGAVMLGIGAAIGLASGIHFPPGVWLAFTVRQAIGGAINGVVFAGALALIGRRRTFATLSVAQLALCGAIGGALFPLISFALVPVSVRAAMSLAQILPGIGVGTVLGASIGAGSLLLARRAPAIGGEAPVPKIDAGVV